MSSYEDLIAESRERFIRESAKHEMTVLRDDGLYRHLRFQEPGTSIYWFDIVTWPGRLVVCGDAGDWMFSRTRDMFEFFGPALGGRGRGGFEDARWGINPGYWSEKLQAPRMAASQTYSYESFQEHVVDWYRNVRQELTARERRLLRAALAEQLLGDHLDAVHSEHEAHRLLDEFEHDGRRIYDSWEWNLREYDWSFLWCCWAIVWGIGQYRAAQKPARRHERVLAWTRGRLRVAAAAA